MNLIDQFAELPTAVLSDVTGDEAQTMTAGIKPVISEPMTAGTAFTVQLHPKDNLMIHKAITLAGAGDILVIDAGGYAEAGLVGELVATSCMSRDLNGIVVDGAVRDVEELEQLGFPVFARSVSPKSSSKLHPGSINVPVSCGGVPIHPGEIIVGDSDGIVAINPDFASEVVVAAERKLEQEAEILERVKSGETIYEIAGFDKVYNEFDFS